MRLPNNDYRDYGLHGRRPVVVRPRRRRRKQPERWRPKWSILLVPAALLLGAYVIAHIEPAFTWDDIMDACAIERRDRFSNLFVAGVVIVGIVSVARVLRDHRKGKD